MAYLNFISRMSLIPYYRAISCYRLCIESPANMLAAASESEWLSASVSGSWMSKDLMWVALVRPALAASTVTKVIQK